jgi:hypothetical protein
MVNGSAYGKRLGGFACVHRRPPCAQFLGLSFAACRLFLLFIVGVAVQMYGMF